MFLFFFNDTATTEIYTLSLHDALPIFRRRWLRRAALLHDIGKLGVSNEILDKPGRLDEAETAAMRNHALYSEDRKSTRLNSSHANISYAVFCLKKKKKNNTH